jgi:diguanylate cyclase (GGDEF)-like protein/PAS domain S-box-containing protein
MLVLAVAGAALIARGPLAGALALAAAAVPSLLVFARRGPYGTAGEEMLHFREIMDAAIDFVCVTDPEGKALYVNAAGRRMLGIDSPGDAVGTPILDYMTAESGEVVVGEGLPEAARRGSWRGQTKLLHREGYTIPTDQVILAHGGEDGDVEYYSTIARDMTWERAAALMLREAEERFRRAFEDSAVSMALVGVGPEGGGLLLEVNDAFCSLTGHTRQQLVQMGFRELPHPDDLESVEEGTERLLAGAVDSFRTQVRCVRADGAVIWVQLNSSVVRNEDAEPLYWIAQLQDVSEERRFEGELRYLADHDTLTGLFNRRRFEEELSREVAASRRYGTGGALVVLDLDNFKFVNDSLGHSVGDDLLVKVGTLLQARLRESDTLARLGGDEFAVIVPHTSEPGARSLAAKLLGAIRGGARVPTGAGSHRVTASAGVALFVDEPGQHTAEDLMVQADIAMYDAKEAGRDKVVRYDSTSARQARMEAKVTWAERTRAALAENRLVLHAQPIASLDGDRRVRHELLLRMISEDGDVIPPASFLGIAERAGLVQQIDSWVVHRAVALLSQQQRAGHPVCLEVNLSAKSIADLRLIDLIERELNTSGADPSGLCFELTETAAIVNVANAQRFAERLGALGCEFAIDDFGAGFASFYYLKHLAFDYLKIDGEFIEELPENRINQLVVRSVVAIARGMGKRTVAEFVGDEQTLDLLRDYGVDYAQGFYIGSPEPVGRVRLHEPPAVAAG